jgi:hypothetical protein
VSLTNLLRGILLPLLFLQTAAATPTPDPELVWNAEWQGHTLRLRPTLRCSTPCRWRFELVTVDMPGQAIRQGGRVELPADTSRPLAQLSLTPAGPDCRLRLNLEDGQGRRIVHELDPCRASPESGRMPAPLD